jgi:hypothetical protein
MDFLDNLLRHLRAYEVEEQRYVSVFPMCLDADANRWLDRWTEQQVKEGTEVTWGLLREAFETRFKHYHLSSVLKDKWRALRMETNGAGKFVDSFMQLTSQLNLEVADEQVIHQFKIGLTEAARRQVVAATGPLRLIDPKRVFTVLELADLVVGQESEGRLLNWVSNSSGTTATTRKENKEVVGGGSDKVCTYCHRIGHEAFECRAKARKEAEASPKPTAAPSTGTPTTDTRACHNCGKVGHLIKDCPSPLRQRK